MLDKRARSHDKLDGDGGPGGRGREESGYCPSAEGGARDTRGKALEGGMARLMMINLMIKKK